MKSFKYTINGNVYKVHISSVVDDIAEVEVNGTPYQVKMEKPAKKQMVTLKRPAQAVKRGQNLLVLEAMKMENNINADRDGKIIEIKVNKGDSVLEGADLVVIG